MHGLSVNIGQVEIGRLVLFVGALFYVSLGKRRGWAMGCWGKQGQSDGDDDDGLKSMVNISGLLLLLFWNAELGRMTAVENEGGFTQTCAYYPTSLGT